MYAQVSFPFSSFKTFTYTIPPSLKKFITLGVCVQAPINNSLKTGFVVGINQYSNYTGKIFNINSIRDTELNLPKELWQTLEWISKYYITPIGQVLKTAIPNTFMDNFNPKKIQFVIITNNGIKFLKTKKNKPPKQIQILKILSNNKEPLKISNLKKHVSSPYTICKKLNDKGYVNILKQTIISDPFNIMSPKYFKKTVLSSEQNNVFNKIKLNSNKFTPYLLHGVTGSGKTEIYLKLAEKIVQMEKSVLILVPEISLTPQVANRFRFVFGNKVALWHSHMSKSEKGWTWKKLKKGFYKIVIGARSAIFSPVKNLGLIIIDEEQEHSYKQENPAPRYNARDIAMIRGRHANAIVLLSSATPSLESYYNSIQQKFTLLKLTKRFGQSHYPKVTLVDMTKNLSEKNNSIIGKLLIQSINNRLKKSEQIILLQNRRGYSRIQQCSGCGEITICDNCSVALTFHQTDNKLHCHYCHKITLIKYKCLTCGSNNLFFNGIGTQKVENVLKTYFPKSKILRMDMDTTRKKNSHYHILETFAKGKADILLGTQMIAKGLDFENVTLVGIINADSGLFFPDFRAGERVFQLIYQVAGRAGRRNKPGEAIIQTYNPNDIYIKTASCLDIHKFYNIALSHRHELNYPPFSRMGRILFTGKDKLRVEESANKIGQMLQGNPNYIILGPATAPIEKIRGNWRVHLLLKTKNKKVMSIHNFLFKSIGFSIFERKWNGIRIQIDVDPISML